MLHATSNPMSIAQYAAIAAYEDETDSITEMKKIFSDRLDFLYDALLDIPGITCIKPSGAFYLFPNVKTAVLNNGFTTVDEWVTALLEEEKVALVPGSDRKSTRLNSSHVAISYAVFCLKT